MSRLGFKLNRRNVNIQVLRYDEYESHGVLLHDDILHGVVHHDYIVQDVHHCAVPHDAVYGVHHDVDPGDDAVRGVDLHDVFPRDDFLSEI